MRAFPPHRLPDFFERFPRLEKTITALNGAGIPFAIGGSGCLFLLGNERAPDDVDIYLPNNRHDGADELFHITSFVHHSPQEDARNSNVDGDHTIQLTSHLVLTIEGKRYDLSLTPSVLNVCLTVEYKHQSVYLYPPEEVLLIKALLQRGAEVGKHDKEDILTFRSIYPTLDFSYLSDRIQSLSAQERIGALLS